MIAIRARRRRARGSEASNIRFDYNLYAILHDSLNHYIIHRIYFVMIPIHLRVAGFLSYRDPIELDFSTFDLACISGANGAGKSSLLDAITWVLFGEARGKSSDVINLHSDVKAAEVGLTFQHEENEYHVQRTLPRNKSTVLEFQIRNSNGWRPLTEKTTRDTQAR